jgi:inner membrane protein COX18
MKRNRTRYLYDKFDCNPIKTFLVPLIQIPLFLSITYAIRNLVGNDFLWFKALDLKAPGIETEGFLFLENLTLVDPTMITPLLVATGHAVNFELTLLLRKQNGVETGAIVRGVMYSLNLVSFFVTMHVPSVFIVN